MAIASEDALMRDETSTASSSRQECRPEALGSAAPTGAAAGYWQTRAVAFGSKDWAVLRPTGELRICVTQQSMAEVIAVVWGDDDKQAEANARLIAAAPELLEALEAFDRWNAAPYGSDAKTFDIERLNTIAHDARAAIAKATGA